MKLFKHIIFTILVFLLNIYASSPTSVPISHQIYPYFERMETLGHVENLLDGIRPYSRAKVAKVLIELDKQRDMLTPIDREKLDGFLLDFRYELQIETKNYHVPEGKTSIRF